MQYAFHFPPCSAYDTAGFERWLEGMAQKGLLLEPDGFYFGFGKFRKSQPSAIRFRLLPAAQNEQKPAAASAELTEDFGWQFYGKYKDFFLYFSSDPDAPELHSDPQLHAESYKKLLKHQILTLAAHVLLSFWFWWKGFRHGVMWALLQYDLWRNLLLLAALVLVLGAPIRDLIHTARLYRKLRANGILTPAKRRNSGYLLTRALTVILLIFLFLTARIDPGSSWRPVEEIPVDAAAQLDFPTMEAFLPGADPTDLESVMQTRTHVLAPELIRLDQVGSLRDSETVLEGYMDIFSYTLRNETLAKWYCKDLIRWCENWWLCRFEPVESTLDQVLYSGHTWETLLIRDGSTVFYIRFGQNSTAPYQLEHWADLWLSAYLDAKTP